MQEKKRLLVVEDTQIYARTFQDMMEILGIEGEVVTSADEAILYLAEKNVDYVITDGLDGEWEIVTKIARDAGVAHCLLLSDELDHLDQAEQKGIAAIVKNKIARNEISFYWLLT